MQKYTYYIRDLVLLCILVVLIQRFIVDTLPAKKTSTPFNSSLHMLDVHDACFLKTLKQNKKTIKKLLQSSESQSEQELLLELYAQLTAIEKEYTYVSPGLALLGPFSSLYLELKQQDLREKAKKMVINSTL